MKSRTLPSKAKLEAKKQTNKKKTVKTLSDIKPEKGRTPLLEQSCRRTYPFVKEGDKAVTFRFTRGHVFHHPTIPAQTYYTQKKQQMFRTIYLNPARCKNIWAIKEISKG